MERRILNISTTCEMKSRRNTASTETVPPAPRACADAVSLSRGCESTWRRMQLRLKGAAVIAPREGKMNPIAAARGRGFSSPFALIISIFAGE